MGDNDLITKEKTQVSYSLFGGGETLGHQRL